MKTEVSDRSGKFGWGRKINKQTMSLWRRKRQQRTRPGSQDFPSQEEPCKSRNLLSHSPGGGGPEGERHADAGERAGSGGDGGIAGLTSIFFSALEKDNVLRVSCRGGEQGTSGRQAGDGFSVGRDKPLSGHMSTIARLCQDGCGAVGGRGAQLQDVLRHQR